jgi:hypothetical protein
VGEPPKFGELGIESGVLGFISRGYPVRQGFMHHVRSAT